MPRVVDHEARRIVIIQAVWALIAQYGIEAVTLRRVAAQAGVSVGRIQHYFDSKEALVRSACAAILVGAEDQWEAANSGAGARERLRALLVHPFARTGAFRSGARVWHAFVAKSVDDPVIAAMIREAKAGTEDEIARLLTATDGDPANARTLLALSDGLAERTLTGSLTADEADAVIDAALAGLGSVVGQLAGVRAPARSPEASKLRGW